MLCPVPGVPERIPNEVSSFVENWTHFIDYLVGWCLQGKSALNFMHIKSCVWFTELGTVVLYLGVVVIGKNTPPLKISRVKWQNNNTFFNFSHFFLFFSIHLHNLPNYTIFSYPDSKFLSGNMCTEYQFRGKNDWIWVYPLIV